MERALGGLVVDDGARVLQPAEGADGRLGLLLRGRRGGCATTHGEASRACQAVAALSPHLREVVTLDKGNGIAGTKGCRLIDMVCPLCKTWYAAALRRAPSLARVYYYHGFVPRRQRESTVMVQAVLRHRAQRAGRSVLFLIKDVSNAFASSLQPALLQTTREEVMPEDFVYFEDRLLNSAFQIKVDEEAITGFPRSGDLMGKSEAPQFLVGTFGKAIGEYNMAMYPASRSFVTTCAFTRKKLDPTLMVYADDVCKAIEVEHDATTEEVDAALMEETALFDSCLLEVGLYQNRKKMEIIPAPRGRRLLRGVFEESIFGKNMRPAARYLGTRLSYNGSNVREREFRITSMRRGWAMFKGYWHADTPDKANRILFQGCVQAAGLAGLEALVWAIADDDTGAGLQEDEGRARLVHLGGAEVVALVAGVFGCAHSKVEDAASDGGPLGRLRAGVGHRVRHDGRGAGLGRRRPASGGGQSLGAPVRPGLAQRRRAVLLRELRGDVGGERLLLVRPETRRRCL